MVTSSSLFSGSGRFTLLLKGKSVGRNQRKSRVLVSSFGSALFFPTLPVLVLLEPLAVCLSFCVSVTRCADHRNFVSPFSICALTKNYRVLST